MIFDIDGVLADSREAVVRNTITLLAEFGQGVQPEKVRGMSTAHSAETVLVSLVPKLSQDKDLLARMLKRLSRITYDNLHLVEPTPLAREVPRLAKKYYLAAASNRKSSAVMVLEMLGIADRFVAIVTSADAPPKPDPGMIILALAKLHVKPSEAVFIGDNREDMEAGKAAGVRSVMLDGTRKEDCGKLLKMLEEAGG